MSDGYDQLSHESLVIGQVEEVSPSSVTVDVDVEAPHGTSFAHGALQRFPRVNGFVVLPCEDGAILAIVTWIGIEAAASSPKTQPADALGMPAPRRRLRAIPLGLLRSTSSAAGGVRLERGALLFPSIGDPVRLPTAAEAAATVPAVGHGTPGTGQVGLHLGTAPMAANIAVSVSANRIFGRHLAILGTTGSGKSCSLTHLLRESAYHAGVSSGSFRAIVLDLNGEYRDAFDDIHADIPIRRYTVGDVEDTTEGARDGAGNKDEGVRQLRVPYWLWNFREWHAFADPSGKSQAPALRQALHMLRTSSGGGLPAGVITLVMGRRVVREFQNEHVADANVQGRLAALDKVMQSCAVFRATADKEARDALDGLESGIRGFLQPKRAKSDAYQWSYGVTGPNVQECQRLAAAFDKALVALGVPDLVGDISSVDAPLPFDAANLVELLGVIAVSSGPDMAGWVAPLQDRLAVAMSDERLMSACGYREGETLEGWINSILGAGTRGQITVLDLSLVPSQAQQIVATVIARILLETLERHRRVGPQVPVVLAVEEAHALMRRRSENSYADGTTGMADVCREAFERIGREGRKFGLSLVVSSQRPSELSETVLSQCNSYLVHRIVNSRDQDFVRRLVPDNLGTLLNEVASYPARTALLVGAATEIPVLVEMAQLEERYRPSSADPDFERAWRGGADLRVADLTSAWTPIEPPPEKVISEPAALKESPSASGVLPSSAADDPPF